MVYVARQRETLISRRENNIEQKKFEKNHQKKFVEQLCRK